MQRYSRDRDRDDEGGRSERGAQARNEERYSQGPRDVRAEFGGSRRDSDYDHNIQNESSYGSNPGSNRWRESGGDRERFEQSYGRGGQQSDYYTGGSPFGGRQRDEDYRESRSNWNEQGGRWQPGGSRPSWSGERRGSHPQQYGETEYGMYGPRYAGSGSGQSNYGPGGYWGSQQHGGYGARQGYGEERGDDRWSRQGYGQSGWQQEFERGQQQMDPDYLQWRAEQIRNLDEDYQRYRQERYRKFADEFGLWRRNRESSSGQPGSGMDASGTESSGTGESRFDQTGARNQSSMGSSGGQTSTGVTGAAQESGSKDKANR